MPKEADLTSGGLVISRRTLLQAFALAPVSKEPLKMLFKEQKEVAFTSSVLTYHEVSASRMASDVVGLIRQGQQPISLDTFIGALYGEVEIPQGLRTFMVTCDDGLFSQYTQGLRAVDTIERQTSWFVPLTLFALTRFEGLPLLTEDLPDDTLSFNDHSHQYMTKAQLVEMLQLGHYVEDHTSDHVDMTRLTDDQRNAQIELSESRIDGLWELAERERTYKAFAYPYGRYRGAESYVASVGFDVAFTTTPSTQQRTSQRYVLGRMGRT